MNYATIHPASQTNTQTGLPGGQTSSGGGSLTPEQTTALAAFAGSAALEDRGASDRITNEKEASHFLRQAALGAGTSEEIARVVALGSRSAWLLEQIRTPEAGRTYPAWTGANESVAAAGWIGTVARRLAAPRTGPTPPGFNDPGQRFTNRILMNALLANASTSPNRRPGFFAPDETVRMKATWVLSKFIPCSIPGGGWDASDKAMQISGWYAMLARYAFKNYADLLEEVTYSPAMARMLTYFGNGRFDGSAHPDENFARELLQLFTIGLWELNQDGSQRLDSVGDPIPTYTQDDIRELAKVFTGLTHYNQADSWYTNPAASVGARSGSTISVEPWTFYDGVTSSTFAGSTYQVTAPGVMPRLRHFQPIYETGAKSALGGRISIPQNTEARANIRITIDGLVNHPSCAPFVAKNLIKHMVTSNPSPSYVARVAKAFEDDGTGVRGNLAAVWEAILLDPEASNTIYSNDRHGRFLDGFEIYAKNTRPLMRENVTSNTIAPGTTGAHNSTFLDGVLFTEPNSGLISESDRNGHFVAWPAYAPSIFGYNSPDHTASPASNWGLLVPENGHLGARALLNAHAQLVNEINSQEPSDTANIDNNRCIDYALFFPVTGTATQLVERINILFCGGCIPSRRIEAMASAIGAMAIDTVAQQEARVSLALQMAAFTTEYWVM
jgi:hypothetical protein